MNIDEIIAHITTLVQTNAVGSIAAGVILLFLLVKRPKMFFSLVLVCAALIGVIVIFDKISSTGITEKNFDALREFK